MTDPLTTTDQTGSFCADLSRLANEPLHGSAPAVDAWFILEYPGPWTAKATEDNLLPPATQAWLAEASTLVAKGRVQFIKQNRSSPAAGITFFLALTRESTPQLFEFHLNSYDDLHSLDLPGLLTGRIGQRHLRSRPLYLVCTNGRRDRCCSRLGLGLYLALAGQVDDAAWQTTHLGGHRFAPTLLALPDGACYGRLTAADLAPMIQAQEAGQLYLRRLRGRCCYDDVVQAADWFLRQETGFRASADFHLLDAHQEGSRWSVRFVRPSSGETHLVVVARRLSEPARLVSCSPEKSKQVPHFQLISIQQEI